MDGWVGGDQKCPSIFFIFKYVNKFDALIPKMVSKVVYGFFIKSYEHFKISKPDNRRPRTHRENSVKKFIDGKWVSAPRKFSEVFQKLPIEKMRFQRQNYEKYLKSKNDIRMPLGPFNKELWAI